MSDLRDMAENFLQQSDITVSQPGNVADGLFAIAWAIEKLANAVTDTAGGPWPKALAEALKEAGT